MKKKSWICWFGIRENMLWASLQTSVIPKVLLRFVASHVLVFYTNLNNIYVCTYLWTVRPEHVLLAIRINPLCNAWKKLDLLFSAYLSNDVLKGISVLKPWVDCVVILKIWKNKQVIFFPRSFPEFPGVPRSSREFPGVPWSSSEFPGVPWSSPEFWEFPRVPPGFFRALSIYLGVLIGFPRDHETVFLFTVFPHIVSSLEYFPQPSEETIQVFITQGKN